MTPERRKPISHYLDLNYPFVVYPETQGGYSITFPDLPGCVSQAKTKEEIPHMAEDARRGWIQTEYEEKREIPEPSDPVKHG